MFYATVLSSSIESLNSPSQRATTADARQLPIKFTAVRPMSMSASTPKITAMGHSGMLNWFTVAAKITNFYGDASGQIWATFWPLEVKKSDYVWERGCIRQEALKRPDF